MKIIPHGTEWQTELQYQNVSTYLRAWYKGEKRFPHRTHVIVLYATVPFETQARQVVEKRRDICSGKHYVPIVILCAMSTSDQKQSAAKRQATGSGHSQAAPRKGDVRNSLVCYRPPLWAMI